MVACSSFPASTHSRALSRQRPEAQHQPGQRGRRLRATWGWPASVLAGRRLLLPLPTRPSSAGTALTACSRDLPTGSSIWHPACRQAARTEDKSKVGASPSLRCHPRSHTVSVQPGERWPVPADSLARARASGRAARPEGRRGGGVHRCARGALVQVQQGHRGLSALALLTASLTHEGLGMTAHLGSPRPPSP